MLVIRKLSACEAGDLRDHLRRLSAADRRLRFGHGVKAAGVERYVDARDWARTWTVGAFDGPHLRGVVELHRCGPWWAMTAELSVSVEGRYQNQGLGTRLVAQALLVARNRGFRTVYLLCLPENRPIQRIVRKFAGEITAVEGDIEARIHPMRATPLSVMAEAFGDGCSLLQGLWSQEPEVANDRPAQHRAEPTKASPRLRPAA
ncbi:GNAT family N-acetyltransferase [Pelagibius litoralis]|uniref:GNAT family N-acetyltransferase n=1 Tax=Pelagibius litoralis TaxID=374515 RepID=A0A967C2S8_9PROT|nr:GNAT family N-acetyltransferase [Pelagibius litoralis]NIA67080.1 GNAT family N-acetyltransferase [Pelagibius litoralis]